MADEYTPTTGNVRSVYAHGGAGQSEDRRRAQFDRWLAAHDRAVKAEARAGAARQIEEAAAGIAYHEGNDEDVVRGMFDAAALLRADEMEKETPDDHA